MRMSFPLSIQILTVFFANLALLFVIFLCFFSTQFNLGWEAVIYSPIGEKVQSLAFATGRQLQVLPHSQWDHVLSEFGEFYGVKFYLFDPSGHQLAGDSVKLPKEVLERVTTPAHFSHHHRRDLDLPPGIRQRRDFGPDEGPPPEEGRESEKPGQTAGPSKSTEASEEQGETAGPSKSAAASEEQGETAGQSKSAAAAPSSGGLLPVKLLDPGKSAPVSGHSFPFARPPGRFFVHTGNPDMTWIGAFIHTDRKHREPGTLLAAAPNLWQTRLILDLRQFGLAILLIFLLSLLVWFPFVYGLTRALNRLTSTTELIAEGKFDTSLKMPRWDEIGRLAHAINTMSSRLSMYESGQRRFLGDIAHEICSPIARLQMALAILEPSCTPEQTASLNDIREEVEQMSCLINELLAFSKAGIRGQDLQLVNIDLESLLKKVSSSPAVATAPTLELESPMVCLGDELLLERAFGNILRNADRYAPNSGPVLIKAERMDKHIIVKFADNGPGVQAEAIELLGEPFYRPESSRNRSSGGVGLGLAIVKTCIEACQGSVSLRNRQPKGLEVEVKLLAVST